MQRHKIVWPYVDDVGREHGDPAPWVLPKSERREFRRWIGNIQFPTGFGEKLQGTFKEVENPKWPAYLKTCDYQ